MISLFAGICFTSVDPEVTHYLLDIETSVDRDLPDNVLYISLDALSAEHMQCYGYHRETAPNICGMENATLYQKAYTTADFTGSSLAAMQTGILPHRTNRVGPYNPLNPYFNTTAELLREKGYRTVARSNHPLFTEKMNHDQGFSSFSEPEKINDSRLAKWPSEFREEIEKNKVYYRAHFIASHTPYDPSKNQYNYSNYRFIKTVQEPYLRPPRNKSINFQRTRNYAGENISLDGRQKFIDHYDENIRAVDKYVGSFIDELKDSGQYRKSLIIITADHGESFNNYGDSIWRHWYPNPSISRVPLIVKYPDQDESRTDDSLASNLDPFKLINEEAGIKVGYEPDAIDLREEKRDRHYTYTLNEGYSLTNGTHFGFYNRKKDYWRYYSLDTKETKQTDEELGRLKTDIEDFYLKVERRDYRSGFESDEEDLNEKLRDLGYLE